MPLNPSDKLFGSLSELSTSDDSLPPIEKWNPEFCGDINIVIKTNGEWWHEGSPIKRKNLYTLFSRVLLKENNQYFLITPVEKLAIKVEWQPFVIQDFELIKHEGSVCYLMLDNCGNKIILKNPNQLAMSRFNDLDLPIICVRRNLFASFSRSCYYRLIDQAEIVNEKGLQTAQITSSGIDFPLGYF